MSIWPRPERHQKLQDVPSGKVIMNRHAHSTVKLIGQDVTTKSLVPVLLANDVSQSHGNTVVIGLLHLGKVEIVDLIVGQVPGRDIRADVLVIVHNRHGSLVAVNRQTGLIRHDAIMISHNAEAVTSRGMKNPRKVHAVAVQRFAVTIRMKQDVTYDHSRGFSIRMLCTRSARTAVIRPRRDEKYQDIVQEIRIAHM